MGVFPFSKRNSDDEKHADSPPSAQEDVVAGYGSGEGEVDAADDLHRGMKPRQLSEFLPSPVLYCSTACFLLY